MPMNPLSPTMAPLGMGSPVPGVNMRPYPQLGPAQGGIGMGAPGAPPPGQEPEDEPVDNVANLARLMSAIGIMQPGAGVDPKMAVAFFAGLGVQAGNRLAKKDRSRGITDNETGIHQNPNTPQPPPPPGGAQPGMNPGGPPMMPMPPTMG